MGNELPKVAALHTVLSQKVAEIEKYLTTLRHCNNEMPAELDGIYLTELQRFLNAKFKWDKQVFCDCFQEIFELDDNHANVLLGKYELAEIIGAMACRIFLCEAGYE